MGILRKSTGTWPSRKHTGASLRQLTFASWAHCELEETVIREMLMVGACERSPGTSERYLPLLRRVFVCRKPSLLSVHLKQ